MYKIRLQKIFFWNLQNGQSGKAFLLTSEFCPQMVVCPCPGAIYMWKNIKKCVLNQNSKRFFWNLQQMVEVVRAFCCHQNFDPKGLSALAPGAIYMYKIIKNVYKIRIQIDHFETCNKWSKWSGLSVDIKTLSPGGCLLLAWGYIHA